MKTLILYYSLGGNTKRIAEIIHSITGGDLVQIDTVVPYTGSYNAIVKQGHEEVNRGYLPKIKPVSIDFASYDRIILGSPVWWYTFAPAMHTFLKGQNWNGKEVHPFATNGGWIGHTFEDFKKVCTGADVRKGLNIKFNGNSLQTPEEEIRNWAANITK